VPIVRGSQLSPRDTAFAAFGAAMPTCGANRRKQPPSLSPSRLNDEGAGFLSASRPFVPQFRRRPTLPRGRPRSTIGAGGLNFSVRNGKRCDPSAKATENPERCPPLRKAAPHFRCRAGTDLKTA